MVSSCQLDSSHPRISGFEDVMTAFVFKLRIKLSLHLSLSMLSIMC